MEGTRTVGKLAVGVVLVAVLVAVVASVTARLAGEQSTGKPPAARLVSPRLSLSVDEDRKDRAARITSTFENATTELQYGYADNIGDGLGITAGRAGFTSATSDLLLVVRRYTELKPDNGLARYVPALEAVDGTASEAGLAGFAAAWARAAEDPVHRRVQDEIVDELYFEPAMKLAAEAGVRTPLGQTIMWDTMIQHGLGGANGTRAIIDETIRTRGTLSGDEAEWLDGFLDARLHHLGHQYDNDPDADTSSRSRIEALRSLLSKGKFSLDVPLTWTVYGSTFTLR